MVRRIYIDSRWRDDPEGTSDNDFWFTLKTSIELPVLQSCLIDSLVFPNVIPCTMAGKNDRLYFRETIAGPTIVDRWVVLREANHDGMELAVELQTQLNSVTQMTGTYTVVFNQSSGTLSFSNSAAAPESFALWSRKDLQGGAASGSLAWPGWLGGATYPLSTTDLQDACETIGHWNGATTDTAAGTLFTCVGWISLFPHRTCYLHSQNLGTPFNSIGPRGQCSILRAIRVNAPYGSYINSDLSHPWDSIDANGQQLSSLQFSLRDVYGELIDLCGRSISFSILFIDTP